MEGVKPVVFFDCLKFLSKRSLKNSALFSGDIDKATILSLKRAYEQGRRPLRSKKIRTTVDDVQVANLLLLWLGSLPCPLLPVEHSCCLANLAYNGGNKDTASMYGSLKALIRCTEPFILEVLFPLFELLHHFHLNAERREESLSCLSAIFTPSIFGTKEDHGLRGIEFEALLRDACSLLIKEYRSLFTSQPDLLPTQDSRHVVECNKENVFEDALDSMISLTFENIISDLDDLGTEASPQKKCKTESSDGTTSFQFMNQHAPLGIDRTRSETNSPTSVL